MQNTSLRIAKLLSGIALLLVPMPAEARHHHGSHCRHGQLYRVSMGKCVGARSALGREIRPVRVAQVEYRSSRRLSRHKSEGSDWYVNILLPHDGSLKGRKTVRPDMTPDKSPDTPDTPDTAPIATPPDMPDVPEIPYPPGWRSWPPKPRDLGS